MLITLADFNERPYRIPNQSESPDLLSFLEKKELEIGVEFLLGYDLMKEFKTAIENSKLPEPIPLDPKWERLINGAEFSNDTGAPTYKYQGWIELIRPALYSLWVPKLAYKLTNVGYVENSTPQQSTLIDNYPFEVEAWNDFVKKAGNSENSHTFYGFMTVNNADYPNWLFNQPQYKNRFDL